MDKGALVPNAADRRVVERASRKTRVTEKSKRADVRAALGHDYVRRVLYRFVAGIYETPLARGMDGHLDTSMVMFNVGEQNARKAMLSTLSEAAPDLVALMLREGETAKRQDEQENEAAHAHLDTDTGD